MTKTDLQETQYEIPNPNNAVNSKIRKYKTETKQKKLPMKARLKLYLYPDKQNTEYRNNDGIHVPPTQVTIFDMEVAIITTPSTNSHFVLFFFSIIPR